MWMDNVFFTIVKMSCWLLLIALLMTSKPQVTGKVFNGTCPKMGPSIKPLLLSEIVILVVPFEEQTSHMFHSRPDFNCWKGYTFFQSFEFSKGYSTAINGNYSENQRDGSMSLQLKPSPYTNLNNLEIELKCYNETVDNVRFWDLDTYTFAWSCEENAAEGTYDEALLIFHQYYNTISSRQINEGLKLYSSRALRKSITPQDIEYCDYRDTAFSCPEDHNSSDSRVLEGSEHQRTQKMIIPIAIVLLVLVVILLYYLNNCTNNRVAPA